MKKTTIELTDDEMRTLAEISALALSLLGTVKSEFANEPKVDAWQSLCATLLKKAKSVPSIARDMELHPELCHWFFKPQYVDRAFFTSVLDEARDAIFWSELVGRVAEHTLEQALPEETLQKMSDEERVMRTSSLESALWHEVMHHGLDRLVFLLPEEDA